MDQALKELAEHLRDQLGDKLLADEVRLGELMITVRRDAIVAVLKSLRDDSNCRFHQLMDICGVDYADESPRFEIVYNLLSMTHNTRIRVKLRTTRTIPCRPSPGCSRPPIGSSAKSGTCMACSSPTTPTCAVC
jgi:NADH-quinone oxidoreductase subunit C